MGDKETEFISSRDWIGSVEVALVIDKLYEVREGFGTKSVRSTNKDFSKYIRFRRQLQNPQENIIDM